MCADSACGAPSAPSPTRPSTALDSVTQLAAEAEERTAALTANQERLTSAIEHLKTSLAQLAVLRAAAGEAKETFQRIRNVVPSK